MSPKAHLAIEENPVPFSVSETLTIFVTQMLGLSIAAERITEMLKQLWNSRTGGPDATLKAIAAHTAGFQAVALFSGLLVVAVSHADPLNIVSQWGTPSSPSGIAHHLPRLLSIFVTGLLVSGGSGVWNHILDILKASKVTSEEKADTDLAANNLPAIPK
jgi:hypothetical protein